MNVILIHDAAIDVYQSAKGRPPVNVVFDFADDGSNFYSYVLDQFKQ